jgi:hypothetical protein
VSTAVRSSASIRAYAAERPAASVARKKSPPVRFATSATTPGSTARRPPAPPAPMATA